MSKSLKQLREKHEEEITVLRRVVNLAFERATVTFGQPVSIPWHDYMDLRKTLQGDPPERIRRIPWLDHLVPSSILALLAADWQPIDTAPKDGTRILLKTADFGAIEGWWEKSVPDFYDDSKQGEWVTEWQICNVDDERNLAHRRLGCGTTPKYWMPLRQIALPVAQPAADKSISVFLHRVRGAILGSIDTHPTDKGRKYWTDRLTDLDQAFALLGIKAGES